MILGMLSIQAGMRFHVAMVSFVARSNELNHGENKQNNESLPRFPTGFVYDICI